MLCYTIETGLCGMDITHILKEQDEDGNTPLHLAATAGLDDCVEVRGRVEGGEKGRGKVGR